MDPASWQIPVIVGSRKFMCPNHLPETGRFELMTCESDWDSLVAFDRRCYPPEWCVDVQWYHDSCEKGYISWLMFVDEKVVGNFQLRDHDSDGDRDCRYVSGIAVLPE